jgi:sulfite exporter TauE/SafE
VNELGVAAAFLAGVVGSGHCATMCGAVAVAPAVAGGPPPASWREASMRRLQYNAGRIASYAVAGALAGLVGAFAGDSIRAVSAMLGGALPAGALIRLLAAAMIVLVGLRLMCDWAWLRWPERLGGRLYAHIAPRATHGVGRMAATPALRRLALGALWGWLPCGLSYTMLLMAFAAGSPLHGAAVMSAFGLGTLPALLGIGLLAGSWRRIRSPAANAAAGWLLVAVGSFAVSATGETLVTALASRHAAVVQEAEAGLVITDAWCGIPAHAGAGASDGATGASDAGAAERLVRR